MKKESFGEWLAASWILSLLAFSLLIAIVSPTLDLLRGGLRSFGEAFGQAFIAFWFSFFGGLFISIPALLIGGPVAGIVWAVLEDVEPPKTRAFERGFYCTLSIGLVLFAAQMFWSGLTTYLIIVLCMGIIGPMVSVSQSTPDDAT
ncbi:hypothetical protein [Jannaschia sp. LMIT008]|uniref:hypothetical protein n=1 Tax=Jannaschia maritima TaxID=3032585 RepID=UPI00281265BD|nr:hypothetical protein [Jannaschia sp. LMIT008]